MILRFSPIYRAFREAAISRAIYARTNAVKFTKGRFNVLSKGLSRKTTNAKAEEKDVKTPSDYLRNRNHALKQRG